MSEQNEKRAAQGQSAHGRAKRRSVCGKRSLPARRATHSNQNGAASWDAMPVGTSASEVEYSVHSEPDDGRFQCTGDMKRQREPDQAEIGDRTCGATEPDIAGDPAPVSRHLPKKARTAARKRLAQTAPLSELYSHLAAEFDTAKNPDGVRLDDYTAGSNKKLWWKCSHHPPHSWEASVYRRTKGNGCNECCKEKRKKRLCELAEIDRKWGEKADAAAATADPTRPLTMSERFPRLAVQFDSERNGGQRFDDLQRSSHELFWWKCEVAGCEWQAQLASRCHGTRCPGCFGRAVTDKNRLSLLRPQLIPEWNGERNGQLTPDKVAYRSHKPVWWRCADPECGHEWEAAPGIRSAGSGCPACVGLVVSDANRLSLLRPLLAAEWHPTRNGEETPETVAYMSHRPVWWECSVCHYEWVAAPSHRSSGSGCHACTGYVVTDRNRLSLLMPQLAFEWHPALNGGLTPNDVAHMSTRHVWWKCKACHYAWVATVNHRSCGSGCPMCTGKVLTVTRSLPYNFPDLALEWNYQRNESFPIDHFAYSNKKVWWICWTCGEEWCALICNRTTGRGCPTCVRYLFTHGTSKAEIKLRKAFMKELEFDDEPAEAGTTPSLSERYEVSDPAVVREANGLEGTGFRPTMIYPDIYLKVGRHRVRRNVFVEYDSVLHADDLHIRRDRAKSRILLDRGRNCVIRVREAVLPSMDFSVDHGMLFCVLSVSNLTDPDYNVERLVKRLAQILRAWNVLD